MKEYTFWQEVKKYVREECVIKANSLDEALEMRTIKRCIVLMKK
jgi:hypothetical protein